MKICASFPWILNKKRLLEVQNHLKWVEDTLNWTINKIYLKSLSKNLQSMEKVEMYGQLSGINVKKIQQNMFGIFRMQYTFSHNGLMNG